MNSKRLKNTRGQFVPIAALVMFTMVVFIFAVINVYNVAKTKLRMQNIADAIALNLAAREALALNFPIDNNQWANVMYTDPTKNTTDLSNGCPADFQNQKRLPGISCVDWKLNGGVFSFPSKPGATDYGRLIQTINDAQRLGLAAFDTLLGAKTEVGKRAMQDVLLKDIPDLTNDKSIRVITWNSDKYLRNVKTALKNAQDNPTSFFANTQQRVQPFMDTMAGAFVPHDTTIRYDRETILKTNVPHAGTATFQQLLNSPDPIGWMEVDPTHLPTVTVGTQGGVQLKRIAVGAMVLKPVSVGLGYTFVVSARSVAFVVPDSGYIPTKDTLQGPPQFLPTYWVKLVPPS